MSFDAVDYSWSRPDPGMLAKAGVKAVCRYLTGAGKAVTRTEINALHAHGIGVVLNFEAGASNAALGAAQGVVDGQRARAAANALGAPSGTPVYFSVDFDVTSQLPRVLAYLHAADGAANQSRAYGEYDVINAFGRYGWQTLAWSKGRISNLAVLYQSSINQTMGGSAIDHNQIRDINHLGAWWPAASKYAQQKPAEPEPILEGDDDMYAMVYSDKANKPHLLQQGDLLVQADPTTERYALAQGAKKLRVSEATHAGLRARTGK